MRGERPRAARYSFVACITLTNLDSGYQTRESTRNLSLFGCQVAPGSSAPLGTRVRVQIIHKGDAFEAQGRVVNVQPSGAAGIVFTDVSERHQRVLDKWVAALRGSNRKVKMSDAAGAAK
jgi:hypothetical protein